MAAEVISGRDLSAALKSEMSVEVKELFKKYGRAPHLAVIIIGDNAGSISYVKGKEKSCNEIGLKNTTFHLNARVSQKTVMSLIKSLNEDETVDGILVQLPLPKSYDEEAIINAIDPSKDVDGFHPTNIAKLWTKKPCLLPCTPKGIIEMLKSKNIEIKGKRVCVMGRSNIVGLPMMKLFIDEDATVTMVHSKTNRQWEITRDADILIVAIGKPKVVNARYIKDGAVVIDVGVNRDPETGKLCGDVDFDDCAPYASYITKVPGGVGPMTICALMQNTIEAFLSHVGAQKEEK
jgi:methylenetetrahydrofolate dehydrogenase (NADP+) / methenyltetrahydrofolate cyclohydrolase